MSCWTLGCGIVGGIAIGAVSVYVTKRWLAQKAEAEAAKTVAGERPTKHFDPKSVPPPNFGGPIVSAALTLEELAADLKLWFTGLGCWPNRQVEVAEAGKKGGICLGEVLDRYGERIGYTDGTFTEGEVEETEPKTRWNGKRIGLWALGGGLAVGYGFTQACWAHWKWQFTVSVYQSLWAFNPLCAILFVGLSMAFPFFAMWRLQAWLIARFGQK